MALGAVFFCVMVLLSLHGQAGAQTTAVPAAAFLGSLGVDLHVAQGYDITKYVPALRYIGVPIVRDAAGNVPTLIALHRQTGVRIDIFNGGDLHGLLDAGHALAAAGALLSLEGPNEPNNFPITYEGRLGGGSGSWTPVADFQRDLYAGVKADPVLKSYPVFHASEGGAETDNVGMQWLTIPPGAGTTMLAGTRYADFANVHNYVSGTCHLYIDNQAWHAADPHVTDCWDGLRVEYGHVWLRGFPGYTDQELQTLPRVTTETGWDSASDPGGEAVQGKVLVNTYLAQFARGWAYTFIYELGDGEGSEGSQGLFHKDWTPKLAATYIHNLTSILADTGTIASPGTLNYTIADRPPTMHDLLLQKSDGTFALVVWGEQVHGSSDVTIDLGDTRATVNVYDVTNGTAPVRQLTNARHIPLTLRDHAMILEIPR